MKKDIEWLKAQICIEMMYLENIRKERWSGVKYQTLRSVYQKINQLDETEVLSEEWIDKNKKYGGVHDIGYYIPVDKLYGKIVPKQEEVDQAYKDGYEKGKEHTFYKGYLEGLADKESEPEKVVVPQFVADWWERDGDLVTLYGGLQVKKKHKFGFISKFHDKGLGDYLLKVEDWIAENDSAFLDLLNGKPYEVEEEQKYNVQFKVRSSSGTVGVFLYKQGDEVLAGDNFKAYYPEEDKFRLTEQEIKDFDPRCWEFRKPV